MAIIRPRIFISSTVFLFVIASFPQVADSQTKPSYIVNATKLFAKLLTGYDRRVIPLVDGPLKVRLSMIVNNYELDVHARKFRVQGFLETFWHDSRLKWDRKKYNISSIFVPIEYIWSPDILLYNYMEGKQVFDIDRGAIVGDTGSVTYYEPIVETAYCEIDMSKFPFDTQTCKMTYGSWKYNGNLLNLTKMFGDEYIAYDANSSKWNLVSSKSKIKTQQFPCCSETFIEYIVTFVIRRKSTYFSYVVIFPAILISALVPFMFFLPSESKERITLGIALIVLCLMEINEVNSVIPRHHQSVPTLIIYQVLTLVWISLAVVLSIFILNIHNRGPRRKKVPDIMRRIFLRGIRHLVCLDGNTYYAVDEQETVSMRGVGRSYERDAIVGMQDGQAVSKAEADMDEIKKHLQSLTQRGTILDARQEIFAEWKQVALVIDRILLIFFSFTFVISTISIFA